MGMVDNTRKKGLTELRLDSTSQTINIKTFTNRCNDPLFQRLRFRGNISSSLQQDPHPPFHLSGSNSDDTNSRLLL